jgi:hypothetical protein
MKRFFNRITNKFLRITAVILSVTFALLVIVILFISPISKYLIEKYSEKYTGRKIEMSWLYVNPFSGRIHAYGLIIHEKKSKSNFITAGDCSFNISLMKLRSSAIDVSSITLDHLWINIIENKSSFNWDGFFTADTTKPKTKPTNSNHWRYSFRDIHLLNAEVVYSETSIPVHYKATKLNVECPFIQSESDTSIFKYDFTFQEHDGGISGRFKMNFKNLDYNLRTVLNDFDMKTLDQYLKEFLDYGNFAARLDADIKAKGNFHDAKILVASGKLGISNFHFGRTVDEDYLRFSKLQFDIDTLSPLNKKYLFQSIILDSAFVKYQLFDSLDNFSRMIGAKGEKVSSAYSEHARENIVFQIVHYIAQVAEDIIHSDYRADELKITNAKALFEDYSLAQKFAVSVSPVNIIAEHVDTRAKRSEIKLHSKINPFGTMDISLNVNPLDFGDFNLGYSIAGIPVPLFNPYSITYTSYPFNDGIISMNGNWLVKDKKIISTNHILVQKAALATKVKKEDAKKLPVRVALFFVRDVDRQIDLSIPITGDLKNPKYHLRSVIIQAVKNLFIKPSLFPVKQIQSTFSDDNKNYDIVEWPTMQAKMNLVHEAQLRKISRYLLFHPKSHITVVPCYYEEREKEALLFFEAKKRFYFSQTHQSRNLISKSDSASIDRMSVKNPAFIRFLHQESATDKDCSVQAKCYHVIGQAQAEADYKKLNTNRKLYLENFFKERNQSDRLTFGQTVKEIPASGFSHYRLYYSTNGIPDK